MRKFPPMMLAIPALVLLALTGCTTSADTVRSTATLTGSAPASTPAVAPTTVDFDAGSTPETTPSVTAPAQVSGVSSAAQTGPDLAGINCGEVLSRGQIGSRIGAGFPTKDVFEAVTPDSGTGVVDGLDCQYAVAASGQWTVQVRLIRYAGANEAAIAIQQVIDQRAQSGGVSSSTTIGGRPANLVISDGGFLVMQLDAGVLSVEIPTGVLDGPRSQVAITALAEFCLGNVTNLT